MNWMLFRTALVLLYLWNIYSIIYCWGHDIFLKSWAENKILFFMSMLLFLKGFHFLYQEQLVHIITQTELQNQTETPWDNILPFKAHLNQFTQSSGIKIDFFLYKACSSFDNIKKSCTIHSYLCIWYGDILYSLAVPSTLKSFDAVYLGA